jgi:beta-galactosidase
MVVRDRSRPSVIIWGTRLNETHGDPALWAATRQAARELDPSRPSSGAMDVHQLTGWAEDVFGFDDYTLTGNGDAALSPPLPGVPYLVTEAVGVVETRPHHVAWTDPPTALARQAALHAQAHNAAMAPRPEAQANPTPRPAARANQTGSGYAGLLAWAAFDYHSLQGHPDAVKWAGVADGFRVPKPGAAIYQAQVNPAVRPVIIPVFFWEPDGAWPSVPPVMIASNCERLEISVDGGLTATALPASDSPLYRNLPYPPFLVTLPIKPVIGMPHPGDLVIRGYLGSQQVAGVQMSADRALDRLAVSADDHAIAADGSDATRVVFRTVDAYGNQRRYFGGQVALTLDGPGTLIGDNPFDFGSYGGLCAVWVRSMTGQPGVITVSAVHPVLGQATVQLQATGLSRMW